MSFESWIAIGSMAASVIAVLVTLLRLPIERATAKADAAGKLTTAASELVDDLQCEIKRLKARVDDLEKSANEQAKVIAEQARVIERLRLDLDIAEVKIAELGRENDELRNENRRLLSRRSYSEGG